MPYIIEATYKQKQYAYDIAEKLGIALPVEETIEAYAGFIAAHAKRYQVRRNADRMKKAEQAQENQPKGQYVISQVEPRLRLQNLKMLKSDNLLDSPEAMTEYMQQQMKALDRERMVVATFDAENRPINISTVAIGTIDAAGTTGREIFKTAILSNASSILLYHNHLSNNITPTKADTAFTRELIKCGKLLEIPVLDHIIIGPSSYYSFKKSTNLFKEVPNKNAA